MSATPQDHWPNGIPTPLEGGESIEDFLEGFPSVKREQVIAVLEKSKAHALAGV